MLRRLRDAAHRERDGALSAIGFSAQAADLAVKAPYVKAPVVAIYDWTGFYIGAHAAVAGYRLMTRDAQRYRIYFPGLELIAPPPA